MKITGIDNTKGAGGVRKSDKPERSGAFRRALAGSLDDVDETPGLEAAVGLGGVDALLAVQQADDSLDREARRRLINRGETLLDGLEALRHGMLMGEIPVDRLVTLAQQVRSRREGCSDPRLGAILDDIELRVEVELAKLTPRG